jgi:hypothetical protein
MKRRLGLLFLLAGTFVAARTLVAQAIQGRPPETAPLVLHTLAVPVAQLALIEAARRLRARRKGNG